MQRVLWLADFLQIEDFEEKCIMDIVITHINKTNCILFLNEAFKKLKASDESTDIWYNLLNHCINFASKNLLEIYNYNKSFATKINSKILDEIIERCLKNFKSIEAKSSKSSALKEIVEFLVSNKNYKDIFDLLKHVKTTTRTKNINGKPFFFCDKIL